MEVPQSHATLVAMNAAELGRAMEAGFSTVKIKAGRDPHAEMKFLDEMSGEFPSLRWRLDFNESLEPDAAAEFLTGLGDKARAAIDFIEEGDETIWERKPLKKLSETGALAAYRHRGFWLAMDTLRDRNELQNLWDSGKAPWKIWKD
jgi:hypothetical protein